MNHLDSFLRDHAGVHSKEAVPAVINMDGLIDGLTDEQWRASFHGLNSIAWIYWHIARVEDSLVSLVVCGRPPLLDDDWTTRLNVDQKGDGEGMTKDEVAALSQAIDVAELRAYRNAVGARTHATLKELGPDQLTDPFTEDDLKYAAEGGAINEREAAWLVGRPREMPLQWWGLQHTQYHLGQIAMLRRAVVTQ